MLDCGYVDAVAAHEEAIRQYMKDYGANFRILDEPLLTTGIGVAFSKNDTRILAAQLTEVSRRCARTAAWNSWSENISRSPRTVWRWSSLNNNSRRIVSRRTFWCLSLAAGLLFLGAVFLLSRHADMQDCERRMTELIDFVKEQSLLLCAV